MRGVVLDFDGVLVRSMELHAESYRRVLGRLNVPVSDAEVFQLEGAQSEGIIEALLEASGRNASPAEIDRLAAEKQRVFQSLGPPQFYPGARALVERVRAAAPRLGLVTGTKRENLDRLIPDLLPMLDAVLAAGSYAQGKPHPEPYQKAADALGLKPAEVAALENAPRGVRSARAAGYGLVVGILTTVTAQDLRSAGAGVVVENHADATARLLRWVGHE